MTRNAVAIGALDGLHLGHRALIRALVAKARRIRGKAVVVTFDLHPAAVLAGSAPPRLLDERTRDGILRGWGVDRIVVLLARPALFRLSPEAFLERLSRRVRPSDFVLGPDFRFGRGRAGNADTIRAAGYGVRIVDPVRAGGRVVSSTRIRAALAEGDIEDARACLGRSLAFDLPVRTGAGRGRRLGYPTLNFPVPTEALAPGVYAGRIDSKAAVFHLGPRPTFGEAKPTLEGHLLGRLVRTPRRSRVELVGRIRSVRRFRSPKALASQISRDILSARRILSRRSSSRTRRGLLEEALRTFVETKAAERRTENFRSRVRALDRKAAGLVLRESPHRVLRSDRTRT